ncbi:cupin domain-containing protein [Arthrobacter sp. B2a2-09]|uniref:cupin domain-containing protein n=1 Tax=Arthrobacter sp. B2a2-09 TaxID=2952822 RepID=UPI0022CD24C7|nr:cupin domain-containing protein [Arthrobacter sp. B2a2-09]MCZ9885124.1 cupin domain-containing protein [Arthrobacter sp. B2a2-09]
MRADNCLEGTQEQSIENVLLVSIENARSAIPDPASYDAHSEDWQELEHLSVELAEDSMGGLWEGTAGSVFFEAWPYTEFCVMIEGHVAIYDHQYRRKDFRAGDAFIVPKGFRGTWTTVTPSRKYFVAMR